MNCPNFSSQSEAQACYSYCLAETGQDIHGLDRDNDGIACE
ncbi:excalibur calcium-binding domain-containing protein [Chloroflexi bacterium TSY]|nr:excalibur calcium-binding domain-containing protein [Chloroflexi bacterium TSY]